MGKSELIITILAFTLSLIFFIASIFHFLEKGILLNNANLYRSKEERAKMNKKPYYRQSAIVFIIFSVTFFNSGLYFIFENGKLLALNIPLIFGALIYAIISEIIIRKQNK